MITSTQTIPELAPEAPYRYFQRSVVSLVCLHLITGGLYGTVWFYKQWKAFQKQKDCCILPFLRAIFPVFHFHKLLDMVKTDATESGVVLKDNYSLYTWLLVIMYVISFIFGFFLLTSTPFLVIVALFEILILVIIARVQATINKIHKVQFGIESKDTTYTVGEITLIVFGILIMLLHS